ncbi:hypothetical protein AB0B28_08095 [Glycomyces sp. NPDC046736]|uniref:hypothetical protein n=1 Tax=Glycomyces sp. NPDC046736 TaxID=3155615 RepID=UPI0033ECAD75
MEPVEIALALAGSSALSGAGASFVTALVSRRLRRAQVGQITEEAHKQIYGAYGELLDELRAELAASRAEVARLRADLARADERGNQLDNDIAELRRRLDRAEQRETVLAAEVTRLGGDLPT